MGTGDKLLTVAAFIGVAGIAAVIGVILGKLTLVLTYGAIVLKHMAAAAV